MTFETGRLVLRRHYLRGHQIARVWLGRVAADDDHGLWIWVPAGSPWLDMATLDGRHLRDVPFREFFSQPITMKKMTWTGPVLMLHQPETENSTWFFFDHQGNFRSWYVNLERPGTRWDDKTLCGIDTIDYDLDIVAQPDRKWRWKDEDEFQAHLAHPDLYWCENEQQVRDEGARVVKLIESGTFPFDGTRTDFRPPPTWQIPDTMPDGWNRPRAW